MCLHDVPHLPGIPRENLVTQLRARVLGQPWVRSRAAFHDEWHQVDHDHSGTFGTQPQQPGVELVQHGRGACACVQIRHLMEVPALRQDGVQHQHPAVAGTQGGE
jgi:hypothetical protein